MTHGYLGVNAAFFLFTAFFASGCRGSSRHEPAPLPVTLAVVADSITGADARFMTGMIAHHAQAITMSRLADARGASSSVRILAGRIINGQEDEIASMRLWLRDHGQASPGPGALAMKMGADGHHAMMPGMLSESQLKELAAATGPVFDKMFLQLMIRHHRGALTMVDELFATDGAAQDHTVFKIASDVHADQTAEIDRMRIMLDAMRRQSPAR